MSKPKRHAKARPASAFLALSDKEKSRAVAIYNVENWDSDPGPLTEAILRELSHGKEKWAKGGGPIVFPVILESQLLAQLDDLAERLGVTRSDLIADGARKVLAARKRRRTTVVKR